MVKKPDVRRVTMLGYRGVGKTSLLTAMYDQFNITVGATNLQLTPDKLSSSILAKQLAELKTLLNTSESTIGQGIKPTMQKRNFSFDLGKKAKPASLSINFTDYPGDYLTNQEIEELDVVYKYIRESDVVLVAIDATALMENDYVWNDKVNGGQQITDIFKEVYQGLKQPRLVLLVPIRSETYMKDQQSRKAMLQRIRISYKQLLDLFEQGNLKEKVAVVITPVQTIGTIVYSHVLMKGREPIFYYKKVTPNAAYAPVDCEQPLRYLLRFLLARYYHDKAWDRWGFGFFNRWFGQDKVFEQAVCAFIKGCKDDDKNSGFLVVQGEKWLKVR